MLACFVFKKAGTALSRAAQVQHTSPNPPFPKDRPCYLQLHLGDDQREDISAQRLCPAEEETLEVVAQMKVYQTLCIPNTSIVPLFFFSLQLPQNINTAPNGVLQHSRGGEAPTHAARARHSPISTRPVWKVRSKATAPSLPPGGSPQEQPSGTEPQHTAAEHAAPAGFHSGHGSPKLVAAPTQPPGSEPGPARGAAGTAARGWQGRHWGSRQKPGTHLVHVEDEVQLADVLKALVQRLHKHLRGEEREGQCRAGPTEVQPRPEPIRSLFTA